MIIDKEKTTVTTLSIATEFAVTLLQEVASQDLGTQVLNDYGREGIAQFILAGIQRNITA